MRFASQYTQDLYQLAEFYGAHLGRSVEAVSGFVYGNGGAIPRLAKGGDCRTATLQHGMFWFDRNWPVDLAWPKGIRRAFDPAAAGFMKPELKPLDISEEEHAILTRLSHLPIWSNGKRPIWWWDMDMRAFIVRSHNQMSLALCAKQGAERFGSRFPKKSAIHAFWTRLKAVSQPKKEAA